MFFVLANAGEITCSPSEQEAIEHSIKNYLNNSNNSTLTYSDSINSGSFINWLICLNSVHLL